MTEFFIIIGIILLLLLFLYFGFKYNLTIEKFDIKTGNGNIQQQNVVSEGTSDGTGGTSGGSGGTTRGTGETTRTITIVSDNNPSVLTDNEQLNFMAVLYTYPPVCLYHPTQNNYVLSNLVNPSDTQATSKGSALIFKKDIDGNKDVNYYPDGITTYSNTYSTYIGNSSNISYLSGTTETQVKFNNIPRYYTICSITKYDNDSNQNIILTSTKSSTIDTDFNNNNSLWVHGHNSTGKRGVVCYNRYLTANADNIRDNWNIPSDIMDTNDGTKFIKHRGNNKKNWVVTCAKNCKNTAPLNAIINGVAMGNIQLDDSSEGNGILSINPYAVDKDDANDMKNANNSHFAFSYIIMWDVCLSDICIKYVSDALIYYLNTGNDLFYDFQTLPYIDKGNVSAKSNTIRQRDIETKQQQEMSDWEKSQLIGKYDMGAGKVEPKEEKIPDYQQYHSHALSDYKSIASAYYNPDFAKLLSTFNINIENQNEFQEKLLELLKLNLIKKEANTDAGTLTIDKILNNIASLDNQISGKKPIYSSSDIINYNKNKNGICNLVDKMPDPSQQSFTKSYDKTGPDPSSTDKNDQSYLWCKCNEDNYNTDICKAFNTCRINYSNNNNGDSTSFSSVTGVDKEIYNNCTNAFPNFPKYLN